MLKEISKKSSFKITYKSHSYKVNIAPMTTATVDIWIDFGCPFSRIAVGQLDKAIAASDKAVHLNLRALRMDKDAAADYGKTTIEALMSNEGCTAEKANSMLDGVRAFSEPFGVTYNFDIARGGQTRDAHRLIKLAAVYGKQIPVALALFTAHFEEGKLISDHQFLKEVSAQNELPDLEVDEMLSSSRFTEDVIRDEAEATIKGITNTPTLFFNGVRSEIGADSAAEYEAIFKTFA